MRHFKLSDYPVEDLSISQIIPYANNPRIHGDRQVDMIEASILKFGMVNPVLVTSNHEIIAGHGRLAAAKKMGMQTIPAIALSHLTEAEVKALRIADNAIALNGEWSLELLGRELELVTSHDLNIKPIELGFETGEIDFHIEMGRNAQLDQTAVNAPPEPLRSEPAVSRPGDQFVIGPHRVSCGDARDLKVFSALLDGKLADVVISDQPWNLPANAISGLGAPKHADFIMASGEMSGAEFSAFTHIVLSNQARACKPGALIYQFIDWRSVGLMIAAGSTEVGELINICVWVKQSGGMGSLYRSQHELVCVFRVPGGKSKNNVQLGVHGRNRSNIWKYQAPTGFGSERKKLEMHPTCKNETMIGDAIMDCTDRGDVVLDAFLGSGTAILAAHQTGRIGMGIELDPHYVDLAVRRIAEVTGEIPIDADGRTFEELRIERAANCEE
jgi:DNA modification methylase